MVQIAEAQKEKMNLEKEVWPWRVLPAERKELLKVSHAQGGTWCLIRFFFSLPFVY